MKASDLIKTLNALIAEHGDLEVYKEYDSMASKTGPDAVNVHTFEKERPQWLHGPYEKNTPLPKDHTYGIMIW